MKFLLMRLYLLTSIVTVINVVTSTNDTKPLPIVFVYIVVPAVCTHGLPSYIRTSIEQAIYTQDDSQVIIASNFAECSEIEKTVDKVPGLMKIDTTRIISERTIKFTNLSRNVFESDYGGELWMTSALRFFILEDIMRTYDYKELLHVEADNMLYGKISSILSILRKSYPLSATPLMANKSFITASVFWISNLYSFVKFNNYMMALITNEDHFYSDYLQWLRRYACCKHGGVDPDVNGMGIKPFAINEMTMLANYHRIRPHDFKLLPVVPSYTYFVHRPFCNMSNFGPGGHEVGEATGHGVWDPNSWGQHIGGTARKKGRDRGFVDSAHIIGQAIITSKCYIKMLCGNQTVSPYAYTGEVALNTTVMYKYCYTAPFVRCHEEYPWTPLWNLHVHSKHTLDYRSVPCQCPTSPFFKEIVTNLGGKENVKKEEEMDKNVDIDFGVLNKAQSAELVSSMVSMID